MVLVDEIDLHLHPRWQRDLIGFLTARFPNAQFIATDHSPLIVQAAADANIALLRREGDHVVNDNNPETIALLKIRGSSAICSRWKNPPAAQWLTTTSFRESGRSSFTLHWTTLPSTWTVGKSTSSPRTAMLAEAPQSRCFG